MPSAGVPLNWLAWLLRWDAISEGFAGLAHMVAALGGCQRGDSADCPYGCFAEVASVCRRRHADASQPAPRDVGFTDILFSWSLNENLYKVCAF